MSEESAIVRVGYKKPMGVAILVLGLISLGLGIAVAGMTGRVNVGSIIPGIVCVLLGPGYLRKPFFWVEAGQVVVPALMGPVKRTYTFSRLSELSVRNGKLYVNEKKLMGRSMADKADWAALEAKLEAARAEDAF